VEAAATGDNEVAVCPGFGEMLCLGMVSLWTDCGFVVVLFLFFLTAAAGRTCGRY
jgi:hypothetical protein